jgi:hypothetical protein
MERNKLRMYRGFNLKLDLKKDEDFGRLKRIGQRLYDDNWQQVRFSLSAFISNNNSLDGSAIQNSWFPQIEADIFISHSHRDLDTAIVFSAWLWETFKLKAFIDSCIWGNSTDLQREIDDEHCFIKSRGVYSYELRNHSTSHVHMMLSTALAMMIDKSECLFFLNTPNSIKSYEETDKTESPWIYSEIATSQIVEKKEPLRLVTESFSHLEGGGEIKKALTITHDLDLSHLTKIDFDNITRWERNKIKSEHPLDTLYRLHPPKKKSKQL